MSLNPYSVHLGDSSPFEVIASTPESLAGLAARIGPDRLVTSPSPGKWSPRDILCHLADCEVAFGFRLRQSLAERNHVIQPFDQDAWSKRYEYMDAHSAIEAFSAMRRWNLLLIQGMKPEELAKAVTHPERGTMTIQTIVETMGGHDRNHLQQLEKIAATAL